jgi:hypothetical protein
MVLSIRVRKSNRGLAHEYAQLLFRTAKRDVVTSSERGAGRRAVASHFTAEMLAPRTAYLAVRR